jgi:hypothetical protein
VADCCALMKCGSVIEIDIFVEISDDGAVTIIGHVFAKNKSFYTYPSDSQCLKVSKASSLRQDSFIGHYSDIVLKCVLLPRKKYFVSVSMLHALY